MNFNLERSNYKTDISINQEASFEVNFEQMLLQKYSAF
jgi:hypothetical protein